MAKPRNSTGKSAKTASAKKTAAVKETVTETPAEVVAETAVAVETPAEETKATEVVAETSVEPKKKRKYTRRTKKEETASVAETPAEKTTATKKTTAKKPEIKAFIQGAGDEKPLDALAEKAKELSGVKSPKSVNLYIKPYEEDGTAKVYYVVDNIEGYFSLFE